MFSVITKHREYLRRWQNWPDYMQTLSDIYELVRFSIQKREQDNGFDLIIMVDGQLGGKVGLTYIDWYARTTEVGYWVNADFQGKGLITTTCKAVVDYVFKDLMLDKMYIRVAEGNVRSRAIPERLGFQCDGPLSHKTWLHGKRIQEVMYSLTLKPMAGITMNEAKHNSRSVIYRPNWGYFDDACRVCCTYLRHAFVF